jgi:TetR/AcrR family transcriptional regulator, fatty acid metabolism regulator protein
MEIKVRLLEIIEAPWEIFTESYLAVLTTKYLPGKMGFAESALYRHFKSVEEVVVTMLQYIADDLDKRLTEYVVKANSVEHKLIAVFNN